MAVGFGAARLLAGARPEGRTASTAMYHATVWGLTALALAMMFAAARSAPQLRRPAGPAALPRRVARAAAWCAVGALPWLGLFVLARRVPLRLVWLWVPDAFLALVAAAAAGAVVVVLRLLRAVRSGGAGGAPGAYRERKDGAQTGQIRQRISGGAGADSYRFGMDGGPYREGGRTWYVS